MHTPSSKNHETLIIGLMSGTSMDGVDAVLVRFAENGQTQTRLIGINAGIQPLGAVHLQMPPLLRAELQALKTSGDNELHRALLAGNTLADIYATAVEKLLAQEKRSAHHITAISVHGQTLRHRPKNNGDTGYTFQLNAPALLAERTGITVVADFRTRDVAAGGQGAPLIPAFHQAWYQQIAPSMNRYSKDPAHPQLVGFLNVGGMANLTFLQDNKIWGGDSGPANILLDDWFILHHPHDPTPYDKDGKWASGGKVDEKLLSIFLSHPYFARAHPKSCGYEEFNREWVRQCIKSLDNPPSSAGVQATLIALSAKSIAQFIHSLPLPTQPNTPREKTLIAFGGGVYNPSLWQALIAELPDWTLISSDSMGIPALWMEATAFAWIAYQTLQGKAGNTPAVTGAKGPRILGAIYPA